MLLALVLSMCGSPPFEVTPKPGNVPLHAVVWATARFKFTVEDGEGHPLPFGSIERGDVVEVSLDLPEGTQFYVRELNEGKEVHFRNQGKPIGPFRVTRQPPPAAPPTPEISAGEEMVFDGCPVVRVWQLTTDTPAPIYELELAGPSMTRTVWSPRLDVGVSCSTNWSWSDGSVDVRVRAHFSDGSMTPWSDALSLDEPTAPLLQRLYFGVMELL